jgi:hypothetical protein
MASPVEEFVTKVTPQTPEQFQQRVQEYERKKSVQQYGVGQNQSNIDALGGGLIGGLRGVAKASSIFPGIGGFGNLIDKGLESYQRSQIQPGDIEAAKAFRAKEEQGVVGQALEPVMGAMMGIEAMYGVFNTAGSTIGLLQNAPAIATGVVKPGENYKAPGVGVGNLGGQELNPYLQDGFQWDDITSTWNLAWNNDITIGQTGMLTIGRTLDQPFWDEEGDEKIVQDSIEYLANPKNGRALYASNIGLSSNFDLRDMRQLESATDQGYGRWISGSMDAAVAWWLAPEVLVAKVAGKGITKATTVFLTSQADRTLARSQFAAGKLFAETGGNAGKRTAIYELAQQMAKSPKTHIANHEIAKISTNPSLVADVLGSAKTADEAFDAILALGGDQQAITNIAERMASKTMDVGGKNMTVVDALTMAQKRREELVGELDMVAKQKSNMAGGLTPYFDNWTNRLNQQMDEMQGIMDEARKELSEFDSIRSAVDFSTGVTRGDVRLTQLKVGRKGSFGVNRVYNQMGKAQRRYERITGDNLWRSTTIKSGGKWGRTIRTFHAAGDYARTTKIRGVARVSDAKDSLIEMQSALTTNPLLRRLSRKPTSAYADDVIDTAKGDWMPSAKRKIDEKRESMSDEAWDEFVASGEFDAWTKQKKLRTATGTREYYYQRMLSATDEIDRYRIFDQYEEQMFMEMALDYGMSREEALVVLGQYKRMRNQVADQIKERGWYWDKPSDEIHNLPDLQSELAEAKPLLDFAFMDRMFRINAGGIAGAAQSARVSAASVLSSVDAVWRPLVLMRLGYTLRNVTESNLREMAYVSQIPGAANARGAIKSKELGWVQLASNAADRLSNIKNFAVHGPLRYGTNGTMRALRKSLDSEAAALSRRQNLVDEIRTEVTKARIERDEMIAKAKRIAAIKKAREIAKDKVPGESVVWQQIEEGIARRKDFYTTVDEIIIDPEFVDDLVQAGWTTGRFTQDVEAGVLASQRGLVETLAPSDGNWKRWLSLEERDQLPVTAHLQARQRMQAMQNWADQTQGQAGIPVRVIDPQAGHYEVIHEPLEWFDNAVATGMNPDDALDTLRIVSADKLDSVKGARVQVGGGVLDLRPGGFGDQWTNVHVDPSVWWGDTWERLFKYSDVYANSPRALYPKVHPITDPLGGAGKYENAVGYVKASEIKDLTWLSDGTDVPFTFNTTAASEWTTPIVIAAYGNPKNPYLVMMDGSKRALAAPDDRYVPVTVRWIDDPDTMLDLDKGPITQTSWSGNEGKLVYLSEPAVDTGAEIARLGGRHFHPGAFNKFMEYRPQQQAKYELENLDYFDNHPAWAGLRDYFGISANYSTARDVMLMVDVARVIKAAEIDPIIRKQVELRLADIADPGYTKWLQDKGHLMDDTEFRQLVDDVLPMDHEETVDAVRQGIRAMSEYQGTAYEGVNDILWSGLPVTEGSSLETVIKGMDWVTQNTHVVTGDKPMRVFRESSYVLDGGGSKIPGFLSTSTNSAQRGVAGSGERMALDLEPGTPYASFERLLNSNWEGEVVLPRGVKAEYVGQAYDDATGITFDNYRVWWDPEDNVEDIARGARWQPGAGRLMGRYIYPRMESKAGPQLGGYTYGRGASGQWVDAYGQTHYVKDYDNPAQGFLEYFFDMDYSTSRTRTSSFVGMPVAGDTPFAYGSIMEEVADFRPVGVVGREGFDVDQATAALKFIPKNMAEDTIMMNFDGVGPAGENLFIGPGPYVNVPWVFGKFDNGASAMFRAHGQRADWKSVDLPFDSILDHADSNGYRDLFDNIRQSVPGMVMDDDMTNGEMRRRLARALYERLDEEIDVYGPVGDRFRRFYKDWKTNRGGGVSQELDDQIDEVADFLNERTRNLIEQLIVYADENPIDISPGSILNVKRKFDERLGNSKIDLPALEGKAKPFLPDESRPAAAIVHAMDQPGQIAESGIAQKLALEYAQENGYGKVITPNPSKGRGYQIQVNPDKVYNGGDNIDAQYPGWLSAEAAGQETVLDMSRFSPDEVFQSTGMDIVSGSKVMQGSMDLSHQARANLAIRMGNEGYTHIVLPNGKKLSQSELIGTGDAGAAYGAALAADEVEAAAQVMLAKSDRYNDLELKIQDLNSRLRSGESKLTERMEAVEEAQKRLSARMSKRKKSGGAVFTGGQLNEKLNYTVIKDGKAEQKTTKVPSAFGDQASLYKQLTSSNDRVAADMFGLSEMTYKGMRTSREKLELTPYTEGYWHGLAEYGERRFSNDIIGQSLLENKTDDEIIELMFGTQRGRSAIRKMDDFKEFRDVVSREALTDGMREDLIAIIAERRQVLDEFFPDQTLRDVMLDPKKTLTADLMRLRMGPRTDLKPFLGNAIEYERGLYKRTIGSVMHVLGTLPEDKLARHPFFRNRYRESMQQQLNTYAEQGFEEFSVDMLEQMSRVARKEALQTLNDTLYTIQRVSTFADSMRLILPFFPAWYSSAKFWMYQVPKNRPENLVRYAMVDSAPDRAGWTVDDDNKRIDGPSSAAFAMVRKLGSAEVGSIAFQIAEEDLGWFEKWIGPQSNVKIPKGSLDMMLQGEFPLIPTSSPLVTVPISWIAASRPDILTNIKDTGDFSFKLGNDEETIITDGTVGEVLASRVIPFGEPTREKDIIDAAVMQYAPAWLNKFIIAARGESSAQLAASAAEIHRSKMTDWELNDKVGEAPKYADSVREAQEFQIFRGMVNATAPFSPQFQSKYQFYIDAWRGIQNTGYEEGWTLDEQEAVFIQRYGKEFFRYTRSKSANQSGMAADIGEYEAVTKYEGLTGDLAAIGKDAKYINMLVKPFNTGDGFNSNVYAWQMNRPIPGSGGRMFRGGQQERMLEIDSQIELGWKEYNNQVTRIEALAEQRGSSPEAVKVAKQKLVSRMAQTEEYQSWFTEFQEISGGRWVDSVNALYRMMDDEDLMRDYGPPEDTPYEDMNKQQQYFWTTQQFIEFRDWTIAKLEEAKANGGSANIDAKSNAALAKVYNQRIQDLGDINDDFRFMHRRFFGGDKLQRTEDNAVVDNG